MSGLLVLFFLLAAQIVAVLVMVLIFVSGISSSLHGAPFVPIRNKIVKDILAFGGVSTDDIFYDLGCGDGRVLISAVRDFGVKRAIGYEVSWWPYLVAKIKLLLFLAYAKNRRRICRENFFNADLSEATFIYMYLFPKLVNRLSEKISGECRPGTKIICPSFPIDITAHPQLRLLKTEKISTIIVYLYQLR